MQQLFLLVILTMTDAGGLSAAFVGTETRAECEARGKAIRTILDGAKVDIREFACVPGAARFEPFAHGTPADAPRFFYRVALGADSVRITQVESLGACKAAQPAAAEPAGARVYCASSSQSMLRAGEKR